MLSQEQVKQLRQGAITSQRRLKKLITYEHQKRTISIKSLLHYASQTRELCDTVLAMDEVLRIFETRTQQAFEKLHSIHPLEGDS